MRKGAAPGIPSVYSNNAPLSLALLKPLVRAYLFGHLSSTVPRLLAALFKLRSRSWTPQQIIDKIKHVISASVSLDKFPAFCALITGSYTFLQIPLHRLSAHVQSTLQARGFNLGHRWYLLFSRYLAAFIAAYLTLPLLNSALPVRNADIRSAADVNPRCKAKDGSSSAYQIRPPLRPEFAGKTMDLTLLASLRALELIVHSAWTASGRNLAGSLSPTASDAIARSIDPLIFSFSASIVMWSWFYAPERLPASYNRWISSAAAVDPRLISALRAARRGEWVYGLDTGKADILSSMCRDHGWPAAWGDPAATVPIPCEVVHMGTGRSCLWHAAVRFSRAFRFALAMYLPLQLAVKAPRVGRRLMTPAVLRSTVREAARSSAFLGAFIALFYYGVCAGRTVVGPKVLSKRTVTPMMWDSGLAVGVGCAMSGWSVLLEAPKRRQELAFFVGPRAMATLLPRVYKKKYFGRERLAFAMSVALLFTAAHGDPRNVRGVVGQFVHGVLSA